jgi:hypothetical protein
MCGVNGENCTAHHLLPMQQNEKINTLDFVQFIADDNVIPNSELYQIIDDVNTTVDSVIFNVYKSNATDVILSIKIDRTAGSLLLINKSKYTRIAIKIDLEFIPTTTTSLYTF